MATNPASDDPRLATILCLWRELQATRRGSEEYHALTKRIRQEADRIRQGTVPPDRESLERPNG